MVDGSDLVIRVVSVQFADHAGGGDPGLSTMNSVLPLRPVSTLLAALLMYRIVDGLDKDTASGLIASICSLQLSTSVLRKDCICGRKETYVDPCILESYIKTLYRHHKCKYKIWHPQQQSWSSSFRDRTGVLQARQSLSVEC